MSNTYPAQPIDGNGRVGECGIAGDTGYAVPQLDNFVTVDSVTGQPTAAQLFTQGGTTTAKVAASVSTDTVIKATAGRLYKVMITTLGTNALVIWDNATGHTGTIIGYVATSAVAGTVSDFQMPAVNGITVQGNTSNPAFTVSFS